MKLRLLSAAFSLVLLFGLTPFPVHAGPVWQVVPVTVTVADNSNLRAGPGTSFDRVGGVEAGATVQVVGCNADCTWYETAEGSWIAAELLVEPPALRRAGAAGIKKPASPVLPQVAAGEAITNVTDARRALVRIEAAGTFVPLGETDTVLESWGGTGFLIDPSGIVVTNAHVVNGGEAFKVYLDGEVSPRYATVLGISECNDLAVLKVRGSGYPYLLGADSAPSVGQRVYALGYPGGKFRSSRGTIEETYALGDTAWASVASVIYHTAQTAPGNSGGPLLSQNGQVVGVNFANNSDDKTTAAISWEEALPIVATLAEGSDVDSIGINGEAFFIEDEDLFGIWVVSVESGSPAAELGVEPADILLALEEMPVGVDGNFGSYCTVLRSHSPGEIMHTALVRLSTEEFLCGQLNGTPLVNCDSFTAASGSGTPQQNGPGTYANGIYAPSSGATVRGYVSIQGVAVHPALSKWQLDLLLDGAKEIFLATGTSMVPAPSELLVLNTGLYPNGQHVLRLRVVKRDGNYDEYFTPVKIAN